jgi:hypothetical protein
MLLNSQLLKVNNGGFELSLPSIRWLEKGEVTAQKGNKGL